MRSEPLLGLFACWGLIPIQRAQGINFIFCVVCVILLLRLLMAMMTNTYTKVHEMAELEWRLLVAHHVLRLEMLGARVLGKHRVEKYLCTGILSQFDSKYYHHFVRVKLQPGESMSTPVLVAQHNLKGAVDWFELAKENEEDYEAKALVEEATDGPESLEDLIKRAASGERKPSEITDLARLSKLSKSQPLPVRSAASQSNEELQRQVLALTEELRQRDEAHRASLDTLAQDVQAIREALQPKRSGTSQRFLWA